MYAVIFTIVENSLQLEDITYYHDCFFFLIIIITIIIIFSFDYYYSDYGLIIILVDLVDCDNFWGFYQNDCGNCQKFSITQGHLEAKSAMNYLPDTNSK